MAKTTSALTRTNRRSLSSGQSAVIGGLSGIVEVAVNQPTVAWKNALQQSRPLPFAPREMYRGVGINAMSIAPITAVQFAANAALVKFVTGDNPANNLSDGARIAVAGAAGASSALVSTPAELIMIRQQRMQAPFFQTAKEALREAPYRGLTLTAARESIFTAGYLGLAPVLGDKLAEAVSTDGSKPTWARTLGSIVAGVFAGTASHAFDTLKTAVQGAVKDEPKSGMAVARDMMANGGGLRALYAGLAPRGLRIVAAVVILQECKVRLEPALFNV